MEGECYILRHKMIKKIVLLSSCIFIYCIVSGIHVIAAEAIPETKLVQIVEPYIGTPYKWGGETAKGFDCSGFTLYIFKELDIDLPHYSKGQAGKGATVAKDALRSGDLVFFDTGGSGISHVGIYLSDGKFVHASSNNGVTINDLSETYYEKTYITARRIIDDALYVEIIRETHQ